MNIWEIDRNERTGQLELIVPISTVSYKPAPDLPPMTFTRGEFTITFPDDGQAEMVSRMLQDEVEIYLVEEAEWQIAVEDWLEEEGVGDEQ